MKTNMQRRGYEQKRHIQSFAELTADERTEIGNTITIAERALKELKIAETVTLVQEERSKHFHIWIFPNQEWMLEKYGYGLQYLRDINAFAKDNASIAFVYTAPFNEYWWLFLDNIFFYLSRKSKILI